MAEPVILARVGARGIRDTNWPSLTRTIIWLLVCAVATASFTIGAILQLTVANLAWMVCGLACFAGAFTLTFAKYPPARREEDVVVTIDRLREATRKGVYGSLLKKRGGISWLTEAGIYLGSDRCVPWTRFSVHRVETLEGNVFRLTLWRSTVQHAPVDKLLEAAVNVLTCIGLLVLWFGAMRGGLLYGFRDDVMATIAAAVLVTSVMTRLFTAHRRLLRSALPDREKSVREIELLVNANDYSKSDVLELVARHVPTAFSESNGPIT